MAESILFNLAASLITKLGSRALRNLGLIWGVDDELQKLQNTVSAIEAVLLDAEEQQFHSNAIKNWISNLKDAFYDADSLIDEFSYENLRRQVTTEDRKKTEQVRIFFSKSNQIAFGLKMGRKVKEIRKKLDAIAADRTQFHFCGRVRVTKDSELKERRCTHSFIREEEVIGRDDDRREIVDLLLDANARENVSVLAIVGIGGLGKTTLTQSVYNHEKINEYFELKLWVCVSEVFDVKIIVEKIIESATNKRSEPLEMDSLQNRLRKEIDGRKYLLIMDDVWNDNYEKWVSLKRLLMGGAKGSKIVITTRSEKVAITSDTDFLYLLRGMSEDNSWLLFKKMAFRSGEELKNSNVIKIGKEIIAKLKGVPLAIRIIGRLLYFKESEVDWLSFKDNELNRIMVQENEIQSILMLSYNHLPSNLKQCFTYCALFPKDHEIPKDEVIKQWIAQGFVQPHGMNKPIEDVGHDYFIELLWRSFFQDIRENEWGDIINFKMHDLMHDLACSIVENECVMASVDVGPIDRRTWHMSFDSDRNRKLKFPDSLFVAKNLRTLLLRHDPRDNRSTKDYSKAFIDKIISNFLQLRTLRLSIRYIAELPESISKLKHLRYLDLSSIYSMPLLPNSITELYNLETLILFYCSQLRELPRYTKNWIRLRHLDIRGCRSLTCMPKGIGELTCLQTLNAFVLGKDGGGRLSELNGLNNLRGSLIIKGLKFCTTIDLNANYLKQKAGLRGLELCWPCEHYKREPKIYAFDDHELLLECLQPHPNLQELHIFGYHGASFSNWLSSNYLIHIVNITLSFCEKLKCLPQFDQFPFLKLLKLQNLNCIEYIDCNNSFSSSTFFPSLEKLSISKMSSLKGWWMGEMLTEFAHKTALLPMFSCLCKLEIDDCPQLTSIPFHPHLESLKICGARMNFLDMVIKTTRSLSEASSSSALFGLRSLRLWRMEDLEFLSEELFCNLTTLVLLEICFCSNLQMSSISSEQHLINEDDACVIWQKLINLRILHLVEIPTLEYLPKGLQLVTTLQFVVIKRCQNLVTLPEWIGNLTSLTTLIIESCPKLTSLPEGMSHLHSLNSLTISGCPIVQERCKEGVGEDWPKIAHVPHLELYPRH